MSEYVHAALLLHSVDKPIDEESLTKVLSAAGITPNEVRVKALVASLEDIDIEEAIKTVAVAPPVGVAAPAEEAKEEPEEEAEEEKKGEEEAIEGLGALFGA